MLNVTVFFARVLTSRLTCVFTRSVRNYNTKMMYNIFVGSITGFPIWGTCTPSGTFAYLKGYI